MPQKTSVNVDALHCLEALVLCFLFSHPRRAYFCRHFSKCPPPSRCSSVNSYDLLLTKAHYFTLAFVLLTLIPQPTMAFHTLPAICSAAPYQPYLRFSVYPPAQGYCSIILSERAVQIGDPNCASKGYLCSLFSYLQAVDPEFAQTVWYVSLGQ